MESFSVSVDLKVFFNDCRANSLIFVDTNCMKKVRHVEKHIKTLFGIESDTYVSSHNNFVPGAEDSRILRSLSSIRLELSSSSSNECKNANEDHNGNEQHQDFASSSTKKHKKKESPYVDLHEILDTGHPSKTKKHKRKRIKNDECNVEDSSDQQITSDDLASITMNTDSPKASKVMKLTLSKQTLSTTARSLSDLNNADESKMNESPNAVFYDKMYEHGLGNTQQVTEESVKKSIESLGGSSCNISDAKSGIYDIANNCETSVEKDERDLNTNTDVLDVKPKRKRIRKRKKAARPETAAQTPEATVPQTKLPRLMISETPTPCYQYTKSESSTPSSKHIYFSEEAEENTDTSLGKTEEEKINTGDASKDTTLECSDNRTGEEEISNETTKPEDPVGNEGPVTPRTACPPTVKKIAKPKSYWPSADRGLGKLLSLVRSENPPVFERKKVMKLGSPAERQEVEGSKFLTSTKSPIRFQSATSQSLTTVAASPLPDVTPTLVPTSVNAVASTSVSSVAITPLKTIPDKKMKISFKMLKMSASYCPELSNPIVCLVEDINPETQDLTLKIISGAEECQEPRGKFDILYPEATEEETVVTEITLKWQDLIEPSVLQ